MKSIVCRFAQAKRFIHSSAAMRAAEAHHGSANVMTINFSTPHSNIYRKKEVTSIVLPGESGDFGVTAGHAAYIAQLQAGVVQINHANGEVEKFFVPGGFSLTNSDSMTDISVTDAFTLDEFDPAAIKAGLDEATANFAKADDGAAKSKALVEMHVYGSLSRAIGGAH